MRVERIRRYLDYSGWAILKLFARMGDTLRHWGKSDSPTPNFSTTRDYNAHISTLVLTYLLLIWT